ncbi:MAG: hypothetical protein ACHQ52_09735 [Candidatus Eisenbacteria bacterium]
MDPSPTPVDLAALHRQLRWLTAVCVFLGLGLVLELSYHFLPAQPEVAANRFVLVDTHGHVRGVFGQWGDGSPVLQLNGGDERERVVLVASPDGSSALRILDTTRTHRVFLQAGRDGWPELVLAGPDGASRLRLKTGPDGVGRIERSDSSGARTLMR